MLHRFVTGLVWGGVVAGLGLAVISQVAPRPVVPPLAAASGKTAGAESPAAPLPEDAAQKPAVVAKDAASAAPVATEAANPATTTSATEAAKPIAKAPATEAPAPATETPATETPATSIPATEVSAKTDATKTAPSETAPTETAPKAEPAAAPAETAPPAAEAPETMASAPSPAQVRADSAAPAALSAADPAKASAADSAPPLTPKADAAPAIGTAPPAMAASDAPLLAPAPKAPALGGAEPAPPVAASVQDPPRLLTPDGDPGLPGKIATVLPDVLPASSSLPQIGAAPEAAAAAQTLPETALPGTALPGTALPETTLIDDLPPIAAFARPFENTDAKPLFALLLVDDGSADLDRATLAALPFAVTFVVDPQAANAAEAAAIYRAGLQEVVMMATGLPDGTQTGDIERSFEANAAVLPETVAVIDTGPQGRLEDRTTAAAVVPILQDQGRGLITYDMGLNAADQAARRAALPTVALFRVLDAEGESQSTIRRYLDRAAFKAAQEGKVVVIGSARPQTVAAILEWTVEGRAASVALAPVTAVLAAP